MVQEEPGKRSQAEDQEGNLEMSSSRIYFLPERRVNKGKGHWYGQGLGQLQRLQRRASW